MHSQTCCFCCYRSPHNNGDDDDPHSHSKQQQASRWRKEQQRWWRRLRHNSSTNTAFTRTAATLLVIAFACALCGVRGGCESGHGVHCCPRTIGQLISFDDAPDAHFTTSTTVSASSTHRWLAIASTRTRVVDRLRRVARAPSRAAVRRANSHDVWFASHFTILSCASLRRHSPACMSLCFADVSTDHIV